MNHVKIGFSRPKKNLIGSVLIRWFENAPFSHVFIKFDNDDEIYQAVGGGVELYPEKDFLEKVLVIDEFCFCVTPQTYSMMYQDALSNVGKKYGFLTILGIAWVRILRLFGKKIKNPFADGEYTEICSELVGRFLIEYFGVKIKKDLEVLGPKFIYRKVKELDDALRVDESFTFR